MSALNRMNRKPSIPKPYEIQHAYRCLIFEQSLFFGFFLRFSSGDLQEKVVKWFLPNPFMKHNGKCKESENPLCEIFI